MNRDCTLKTFSGDSKPFHPLWVEGTCWSNDWTSVCGEIIIKPFLCVQVSSSVSIWDNSCKLFVLSFYSQTTPAKLTQQWDNLPGTQPGTRWSRLPVWFLHDRRRSPRRPIQTGAECHWSNRMLPPLSPSPLPSGSHFSGQHPNTQWPLGALPL